MSGVKWPLEGSKEYNKQSANIYSFNSLLSLWTLMTFNEMYSQGSHWNFVGGVKVTHTIFSLHSKLHFKKYH